MVGSALIRQLSRQPNVALITRDRANLELTDQKGVRDFFSREKIDQVFMASAKVGGILANLTYPAEFIFQNLMVECNIIHSAHLAGVDRILFLGSSCIYPKFAAQPMTEDQLLTGVPEETNEPYAIAKIAGIKLCESYNRQFGRDYRSVMPTNLYGENDNFHPDNAHVIPALIRRFHEAKLDSAEKVVVWGSGRPRREFLHVDDLAAACVYIMNMAKADYARYTQPRLSHVNIGTGADVTIRELAEIVAEVVGFKGRIEFDASKPDGPPRKLLNVDLIHRMGWRHRIGLKEGLQSTYQWFLEHQDTFRK
jgi:GDP-L-fucose synthase